MTVGFPLGGHRELCDESGAESCRRFTARRQGIPDSPLDDKLEDQEECFTNPWTRGGSDSRVALASNRWLPSGRT